MKESPTILVTGSNGQIGYELTRELMPLGSLHACTRGDIDLSDLSAVRNTVRRLRPNVIVNAAAYTAVDKAESEPELCARINADAPSVLAEEARRIGSILIHYSTDYVFDGTKNAPYTETDPPAPLSVYGASKLAGERAIASTGGNYLIFRTSWVYGSRGHNFLRSILRSATQQPSLAVVNDQTGAPTWSRMIAGATAFIVRDLLWSRGGPGADFHELSGVYNLSAGETATWFDFASAALATKELPSGGVPRIVPIASAEYPVAAVRPAYSVLNNEKIHSQFGIRLPSWRRQLELVLTDIDSAAAGADSKAAPRKTET